MTRAVVVTGLSGAGKASILRALEDLGFNAVDNPPLTLLETLIARSEQPTAIGLDCRSLGFDVDGVRSIIARLKTAPDTRLELVYAWAEEAVLLRRFTETRRRHPLSPRGRVIDGIRAEEMSTGPLRMEADLVIDTSELPLAELRQRIEKRFRPSLPTDVTSAVAHPRHHVVRLPRRSAPRSRHGVRRPFSSQSALRSHITPLHGSSASSRGLCRGRPRISSVFFLVSSRCSR